MRYFVMCWLDKYEPHSEHWFDSESEAIAFINETVQHSPGAAFKVIRGNLMELEPVSIIRSFRFKK